MKIELKLGMINEYRPIEIDENVTLKELADKYQDENPYRILIAKVNGYVRELSGKVEDGDVVEFKFNV